MIPESFGRYRIQERLGEGGMGSVWKAEDTLLHRVVALKFLSAELVDSPEARQRFLREARSASVLEHPGIATVFDAGEVDGTPYLAVQLVEGMTLADRIRQGPLPVAEAVEIHRQAAEALAHAHSRKVLHRDISSRNLMLKPGGSVVLVDFGLAKRSDMTQLTRTGTTQGTIAYLAPEVLEGSPATEASDRYSLGVVLYEMLTGELPFRGERVEAVMLKIMTEDPEPPSVLKSEVPPEVDRMVLQLLAKDPVARGQVEAGGAVAAQTKPTWIPPITRTVAPQSTTHPRWNSGRWKVFLLVGALLLGALAAAVLFKPVARLPRLRSIAVLPMVNRSVSQEETDYVAETTSDFFSQRLSEIDGLRVIPWTSTQHLGNSPDPLDAARRLNVDALLTGSLRVENGQIQMELTLVDGKNGRAVWKQEFTSSMTEIQEVEGSAILVLLEHIHEPLTEEKRRQVARATSQSPDAYELYRRGVQSLRTGTQDGNDEAIRLFSRAISIDTTNADAYSGLGASFMNQFNSEWGGGSELITKARRSFEKALALDPGSISARRGLAQCLIESSEIHEAIKIGLEVLALNPSSTEHRLAAGSIFSMTGLQKAGVQLLRAALVDDPTNRAAIWFLALALSGNGEAAECVKVCGAYEQLEGEDSELLYQKAINLAVIGNVEQAILELKRSIDLADGGRSIKAAVSLGFLQHRLGRNDEARRAAKFVLDQTGPRLVADPDNVHTLQAHAGAQALLSMSAGSTDREDSLAVSFATNSWNDGSYFALLVQGREDLAEEIFCRGADDGSGGTYLSEDRAYFPEFYQKHRVKECIRKLFERQQARSDEILREFNIAGS